MLLDLLVRENALRTAKVGTVIWMTANIGYREI